MEVDVEESRCELLHPSAFRWFDIQEVHRMLGRCVSVVKAPYGIAELDPVHGGLIVDEPIDVATGSGQTA